MKKNTENWTSVVICGTNQSLLSCKGTLSFSCWRHSQASTSARLQHLSRSFSLNSCIIITTVRIIFLVKATDTHGSTHQSHSLALFMRLISFSSLMASVMSPLIRSFPDMKAMVGFSFPETIQNKHGYNTVETSQQLVSVVHPAAVTWLYCNQVQIWGTVLVLQVFLLYATLFSHSRNLRTNYFTKDFSLVSMLWTTGL